MSRRQIRTSFDLSGDLRQGWRRVRRAPGFSLVVVLTLALGVGANASVFTLINAVILAPLPVPDPDALYRLGDNNACCVNTGLLGDFSLFSWPLYNALRDATPEFESLTAFQADPQPMSLRWNGRPAEPLVTEFVAPNYFAVLGVKPMLGLLWSTTAAPADGAIPIILSAAAWHAHYNGNPGIIGTTLNLSGQSATVLAVMPDGFFGDTLRPNGVEVWVPLTFEPEIQGRNSVLAAPDTNWLYALGRLRPGVDPGALSVKVTATLRAWLSATLPLTAADRAALPRQRVVVTSARGGVALIRYANQQALVLLSLAAGAVLLVACANLTNLVLARGLARGQELAIRRAIGASRSRLIREALVDSALLTLAGGALGVALAVPAASALIRLTFPGAHGMPLTSATAWPVLLFAFALSMLAALLFGSIPALVLSRDPARDVTRASSRVIGDRGLWPRRILIVAQVTLSLTLVAAAALLGRSAHNLVAQPFGFDPTGRLIVQLDRGLGGLEPSSLPATYQRLEDRLAAIPGVRSVGLSLYAPMTGNNWSSGISVEGRSDQLGSSWDRVNATYFTAIGTPLLRGRTFDGRDTPDGERVAVVNEAFARRMFPGRDPIGGRFGFRSPDHLHASDYTVIGVVGDAKYLDARDDPYSTFFLPFFQDVAFADPVSESVQTRSNYAASIELWVPVPGPGLEVSVRQAIAAVNPGLVVERVVTMREQLQDDFTRNVLVGWLAALFAGLALLLACIGLYGVTAYGVSRRTREIGVRMALGANRPRIVRGVLGQALIQTAAGVALGVPAAIAAARLFREQLFGVSATSLGTLGVAALVLFGAAALAAALPAKRSASVDPVAALRD